MDQHPLRGLSNLPVLKRFQTQEQVFDWISARLAYANRHDNLPYENLCESAIRMLTRTELQVLDFVRHAMRTRMLMLPLVMYHSLDPDEGLGGYSDDDVLRDAYNGTAYSSRFRRMTQLPDIGFFEDQTAVQDYIDETYDVQSCDDCGEISYNRTLRESNVGEVCGNCIGHHYVYSHYERFYIHEDSVRRGLDADGETVVFCEGNDDFHWSEDEDTYVHCDYSPPEPELICSYHSSKNRFSKQYDEWTRINRRFFGVELEVEVSESSRFEAADKIHQAVNGGEIGEKLFFENDGSLSHGFEMITHPMSLPAHRELWSFLKNREIVDGVFSHKTSTCGLHVHVSREYMTSLQIAKMVAFVNAPQNEEFIRAIARRYQTGYCKIKDKSKIGTAHLSNDRYEAINVTGRRTVEFRLFKGSTRYEAIVAALEFTNAIVEFSALGKNSVKSLHWEEFMQFCNKQLKSETKIMLPYVESRLKLAA